MLTYYILVALLTIALIAIAVLWTRSRRAPRNSSPPAKSASGPPTVVRADTHAEFPDTASRLENCDPGATLVYKRSSQGPAAAKKREGVGVAASTGAHVVGLTGGLKGHSFPVPVGGITIGRSLYCDIVLSDPRVSSHHAWIGFIDEKAVLRDLKSTNGTFLNAQINSPVTEAPLRSGDTIFVGGHQGDQFRFVAD
jgi:hypothetical protein